MNGVMNKTELQKSNERLQRKQNMVEEILT